jgi:hypothetical protein
MESTPSQFGTILSGCEPEGAVAAPIRAENFEPEGGSVDTAPGGMERQPSSSSENEIITSTPASQPPDEDRLWTSTDLCRYLGCCERSLRTMRQAGLPTIKFRHLIRFDPETVKLWLRENCQG